MMADARMGTAAYSHIHWDVGEKSGSFKAKMRRSSDTFMRNRSEKNDKDLGMAHSAGMTQGRLRCALLQIGVA
jgi:hypothetical protein